MNNFSSKLHNCIICGDSGFSILDNPILFCYSCKGNLNEEQMLRIQKALKNTELSEFREELKEAKTWSENLISAKNREIAGLNAKLKHITESRDGNVKLLRRAQELGLEAMVENRDIRKVISSLRKSVDIYLQNYQGHNQPPVLSGYEIIKREDELIKKLEACYK